MKVLLSGADGMLGSQLVRELLGRGNSIRVLVIPGSKSKTLDGLDIEKIPCDITTDTATVTNAMKGCDASINCAAITDQWASPEITWKVNHEGTRVMLDGAVAAGLKKFVQIGSGSSFRFGTIENPADETAPFPPEYKGVAYAESKHAANELVRKYVREKDLDAVITCPTFMFGPYDSRPSSGELIVKFVQQKMRYTSPGGRNFVHTKCVSVAVANALTMGRKGETYILGGVNMNYLDFFNKVAARVGMPPLKAALPAPIVIAAGWGGSIYGKLTGKKVPLNATLARLAVCGAYYNPAKATKELGLPPTDVDKCIDDSIKSLIEFGYLKL